MSDAAPFQPLPARLAGLPVDDTLHDGVPTWLVDPLREWLVNAVRDDEALARRVVMRLRLNRIRPRSPNREVVLTCNDDQLLTVVDAVLQLHPGWTWTMPDWGEQRSYGTVEWMADQLVDLAGIFDDAASRYTLDVDQHCLITRVDSTVAQAVDKAITAAEPTAADYLRTAWVAAYGLSPDPDKVFHESIRAVEAVACPLVQAKKAAAGTATLGTVIGELHATAAAKWELALPGKSGATRDAAPLVEMLELLWQAQVSRHGGAPKSRRQDQEEAEAAVHLAALLVHWLSTGVLRRRP